jgi:predicted transcriptional regulator
MSELDMELLRDLAWAQSNWLRPMDLGGTDASAHSRRLRRLVSMGLVERKRRDSIMNNLGSRRGSYVYRITKAGRTHIQQVKVDR